MPRPLGITNPGESYRPNRRHHFVTQVQFLM